jgi:hypothetical protein
MQKAISLMVHKQATMTLQGWRQVTLNSKRSHHLIQLGQRNGQHHKAMLAFNLWCQAYQILQQRRRTSNIAKQFLCDTMLRRSILAWQESCKERVHAKEQWQEVQEYTKRRLNTISFQAWRKLIQQEAAHKQMLARCLAHMTKKQMCQGFFLWRDVAVVARMVCASL